MFDSAHWNINQTDMLFDSADWNSSHTDVLFDSLSNRHAGILIDSVD